MNSTQEGLGRGSKVCRPADWMDVMTFFVVNFGLHALTVITAPGDSPFRCAQLILMAIIAPFSGIVPACDKLQRMAGLGQNDLEMALMSEALCMLVPATIQNIAGHDSDNDSFAQPSSPTDSMDSNLISTGGCTPSSTSEKQAKQTLPGPIKLKEVVPSRKVINGQYPANIEPLGKLEQAVDEEMASAAPPPLQYSMVRVPYSFEVHPLLEDNKSETGFGQGDSGLGKQPTPKGIVTPRLSYTYNMVKSTSALIQISYGCFALYKVSDDQIQRYGYAAYQITVIPYVFMSLINLIASLSGPSYPAMFIVYYRGTVVPSTTGDTKPEPGPVGVVDPAATLDRPWGPDEGVPGPETAESGDKSGKEVYPKGWWTEDDRRKVEMMVSGAVGCVYGDFHETKTYAAATNTATERVKRRTNSFVSVGFPHPVKS